ncbi:transcriptional regulator with XRE-family HTH domain [Variovorax sp. 1133]
MAPKQTPSPFPTATKSRVPARLAKPHPRVEKEALKRSQAAAQLGGQIRSLRLAGDISAASLAKGAGLSRSMLSRIEHGLVSPSIEALHRISTALDVPMSRFFVDQIRRTDCSYVPAGKGLRVEREGVIRGYSYELIGHLLSGNLFVEPYKVELAAEAEPYTTFQHPGTKFLYFLSGRLKYRYGNRVMSIGPGDSLLFDATALHGAEAILERPVSYLSVVFTLRD